VDDFGISEVAADAGLRVGFGVPKSGEPPRRSNQPSPFGMPKAFEGFGLEGRIAWRRLMFNTAAAARMNPLGRTAHRRQFVIATRASAETKQRFTALAASRGMTESRLLTLLIEAVLERNTGAACETCSATTAKTSERVSLRLKSGDRALLAVRAAGRGMRTASYLAMLVRTHVRRDTPLPMAEIDLLKVAVAQLSAFSRRLDGSTTDELRALVEAVRREVAEIVRSNLMSWESDND
jgi:hypothetical protein